MQEKVTKCLGMVTQYNPLTIVPGALLRADDCLIRRENIIEDRRGHQLYSTFGSNIDKTMTYQNRVLVNRGSTIDYDNGSGTFASYSGSYSAPSGEKMRSVEAFSNLYVTTDSGVKVFSDISGSAARLAGAPRSLDPSYALTGASGFLTNGNQCAYRSVLQRTDANANVLTGYPSQRLWVVNGSGTDKNVILTVYLPSEVVTGDVFQVYRTAQQTGTSTDIAADEMGLVYQYQLTSSDISAGYVTFTDSITDDLRGATLYTSQSQEGIAQANDRPPLCKDMALYKSSYMLYANTKTKERLFFSLVGAGSLTGKTITLGGVTYNFGASEITSGGGAPQALVSATGVASVDIDLTARSLIRVINRYAGNTSVYAYYLSGAGDLPGQIMVEEKGIGAASFTIQASDTTIAGMFFPQPPVSPSTNSKSTSSNEERQNYIYVSKADQLEHVPALSRYPVGSGNTPILRVIALRDSAIVIKSDGVYRFSGDSPTSFTVVSVDDTVFCKANDSVVKLANQVMMLSNQGVVLISETGVQVVSHEIEPALTPLLLNQNLSTLTSACAYESERSYYLSTLTSATDTSATHTLVYNVFTKSWVRHSYAFNTAIIEPQSDKMYFSKNGDRLYRERKSFSDADYADPDLDMTITAISGDTVDFTTAGTTPLVGWVISQNDFEMNISEISTVGSGFRATLLSDAPSAWTTGAATLLPSVGMDIEWQPWVGPGPDSLKQVSMAAILGDDSLNDSSGTALTFKFRSNYFPEFEEVPITQSKDTWGSAWGSTPWGGGGDPVGYPTYVPANMNYCTRMTLGVKHSYARQKLVVAGYAVSYVVASDRIGT